MLTLESLQRCLGGKISNGQLRCPGPGHSAADESLSIKLDPNAPDGFVAHSFADDNPIVCRDYIREKCGQAPWKPNANGKARRSEDEIEAALAAAIKRQPDSKSRVVCAYPYSNEVGALLYEVVRLEPKSFRQRRPDGNGGWIWKLEGVRRVIYRWPELLQFPDATVFVCEGEKDADRVASLGHCATTVAGGKWTDECVKAFAGRDCFVLEDNDETGRKKAHEAASALHGTARSVRIVRLPDLPDKGDVSDWLDADTRNAEKLVDICFSASPWQPHVDTVGSDAPPEEPNTASRENTDTSVLDVQPWWRDPTTIPPREFLYSRHYIRRNIGASIGAGGRLKTSHSLFEAVEMTAGRNLATGEALPNGPLRVGCLNAEEEQDELDRRTAAICQRYNVSQADLGGRLFVKSVRDEPLRLAILERGVPTLNQPALERLTRFIKQGRLDVFMLDPWVSFHAVNESANMDMDLVIKQGLGTIASKTNSAGEIFHHPGKPKPGQVETAVEDARGASAIIWAVRSARVFNFMAPDEAAKLGIPEDHRRRHIRIANGKANMGPLGKAEWIKIEVENLPNGDEVACASRWSPPNPFDGISSTQVELARELARTGAHRADSRSPQWFGYALAPVLGISVIYGADNKPSDLARLHSIIKTWCKNKALKIEVRKDDQRKEKAFIVPGNFHSELDATVDEVMPEDEFTLQ